MDLLVVSIALTIDRRSGRTVWVTHHQDGQPATDLTPAELQLIYAGLDAMLQASRAASLPTGAPS